MLLAHRVLPYEAVVAGIEGALAVGSVDPDVVIVEARRATERPRGTCWHDALISARFDRPAPFTRATTTTYWRRADDQDDPDRRNRGHRRGQPGAAPADGARRSASAWPRWPSVRRASHLAYLADVLAAEVDDRAERAAASGASTRLASRAPSAWPTSTCRPLRSNAATIATLASGAYLDKGEPVVLLGDSGTGKSHLLIGMGMAACEQGRPVRYATCAGLVNELAEAADERRLSRLVARYGRLDLLLLDELGYVQLDARGAELFFQILTEREEKSSVAVASQPPVQRVGPGHHRPRVWWPPSSTG